MPELKPKVRGDLGLTHDTEVLVHVGRFGDFEVGDVRVVGDFGLVEGRVNLGDVGLSLGSLGDLGQQILPTLISFKDV